MSGSREDADWLVTAFKFPAETCTLHPRPAVWHCDSGWRGRHRLVTLIVCWHSPYWVMINYPISWTGFHNRLLIVSSSTPGIVIEDWAIIEIPFRWHPQCHKERLGTICPHDILRLTYLISIKRFEAGWLSFNGRTVPDNTDKSH